jgi:Tfp pilus assembly protein PilF
MLTNSLTKNNFVMRKNLTVWVCMLALLVFTIPGIAQKKEMNWTTKSEAAKKLAMKGAVHMLNLENAQAYDLFKTALEMDPDFVIPLVFMTTMTVGRPQKDYRDRAIKSAATKTEGEKLFASTVAPGNTAVAFRQAWSDLSDMFPDDAMIVANYIATRSTPQQQFIAAEEYIKKFPNEPSMYNLLGYLYLSVKNDTANAKVNLEKYIQLYPEGCNPYDSMGEFYFNMGDMANSEKFYIMALEKYPFNTSSIDKLKEIQANKGK